MTSIIVRPRRAGKTYESVQWVLAGQRTDSYPGWSRVLLTGSIQEAERIRSAHPELEYRQVFSWSEWQAARLGKKPVEVGIDNADMILSTILQQQVGLITMNGVVAP